MKPIDLAEVEDFVAQHIGEFHQARLESLARLSLSGLLRRKNPYLLKAKNLEQAGDFVEALLQAHQSSSEEELFGHFMERLAFFVAQRVFEAQPSSFIGIDFEFLRPDGRYSIVQVKSGPHWGNADQHRRLRQNFASAYEVLIRQYDHVQPVLGICYGRVRQRNQEDYLRLIGQSFWAYIGNSQALYTEIIEPIGTQAKRHNDLFYAERSRVVNRLIAELLGQFSHEGRIDWSAIVAWSSSSE